MAIIYKATNTQNGKCYVGKTTKHLLKRKTEHEKSTRSTGFQGAIKKYGPHSFEWKVLEECDDHLAEEREAKWIISENAISHGYNLTFGGDGASIGNLNVAKRPEVREKLRAKSTGRRHTEETKQQIREKILGSKHSEEAKIKISKASMGRPKKEGASHSKSVEYLIIDPHGNSFEIKGMRKFCRDNNLNAKLLRRTAKGLQSDHKGFRCRAIS